MKITITVETDDGRKFAISGPLTSSLDAELITQGNSMVSVLVELLKKKGILFEKYSVWTEGI